MKVLIVVTHLLGTGHLSRALTLARAFADQGHQVQVASGGMPAPQLDHRGIELLQLPPLRSDGTNFTRLLDINSTVASMAYLAQRSAALNNALTTLHPDILITELFPFGRRSLSDEFLGLLTTARAQSLKPARAQSSKPIILASIRDILAPPSKPSKAQRTDDIITTYYDAVLVHSDPNSTKLEQSWPVSDQLSPYLRYTGYVAPPVARPHKDGIGAGEILVSAGGGSVGLSLFETAVRAAHLMPGHTWRLLVGGQDTASQIDTLKRLATGSRTIIIEPARPDFRQMLQAAAASVSMCGYNTALDLLQAGTPAVLVPFEAGNEVEQTLRATSLAALPGMSVLNNAALTPETLVEHLKRVMADRSRPNGDLMFDGAAQTVQMACDMVRDRK